MSEGTIFTSLVNNVWGDILFGDTSHYDIIMNFFRSDFINNQFMFLTISVFHITSISSTHPCHSHVQNCLQQILYRPLPLLDNWCIQYTATFHCTHCLLSSMNILGLHSQFCIYNYNFWAARQVHISLLSTPHIFPCSSSFQPWSIGKGASILRVVALFHTAAC